MQTQNQYLDDVIDPNVKKVNRIFVLPFENNKVRYKARYKGIFFRL